MARRWHAGRPAASHRNVVSLCAAVLTRDFNYEVRDDLSHRRADVTVERVSISHRTVRWYVISWENSPVRKPLPPNVIVWLPGASGLSSK
jgi:hypothetical protein